MFAPTAIHSQLTMFLAHIGKSASLSQVALSAMNIDVDTSRFLDIVSPFTTRTLRDRKISIKENLTKTVSSASIRKSDIKPNLVMVESPDSSKKDRINAVDQSSSLSSAASSSKSRHVRSLSQSRVATKSGLLSRFFEFGWADLCSVTHDAPELSTPASKSLAKAPVFVPLKPIKGSTTLANKSVTTPSRTVLPSGTTPKTVKVRSASGKENAGLKEPRVPKPTTFDENSMVRTPSEKRLKKPVGPRKPPPMLTPEKKRKVAGAENAVSPKKPPLTTRSGGRGLTDLSNAKANPDVLGAKSRNLNVQPAFTSPDHTFFTSPDTTELSMNLNIHGDSYVSESVWLNRTTESTGKSQNESSFASLGKGSVKERWMDWERERERLREMDKGGIKETDDEDTSRLRRSIMTVMSEPEPDTDVPLETDLDATMEFAPVFRGSEEQSRRSVTAESTGQIIADVNAKAEEKERETESIFGRRRVSQGSRILQTLLAAEPVMVISPPTQPGRF